MSWIERLRGFRAEASARVPSEFTSIKRGDPPTFVPDMILERTWDRDDISHKKKMWLQNPFASRLVNLVEKAFDDWFIIRDEDGNEHSQNREIQAELTRLRAKHFLTMSFEGERWAGNTWLQVIKEKNDFHVDIDVQDSEQAPLRIAGLDFWTPDIATVKTYDPVTGAPSTIEIQYDVGVADYNKITIEKILSAHDMINIRTRPYDRSHEGRSIFENVWDFLVWIYWMYHANNWYAIKVGMGWLYAKVRKLTPEKRVAMEANLKEMSFMRFLLFEPDVEDIGFLQADGGSIDFAKYIDVILNAIATGADMPKVALIGQEQGNISGGEGIENALYSTLKAIQNSADPYIRELLLRMNYDPDGMVFDWNTRFAHDAKTEAEIEVSHVSAQVARKGYMAINEIRALDNLPDVEGGDESPAMMNTINVGFRGQEEEEEEEEPTTPSKQEQTRNPEGVQS